MTEAEKNTFTIMAEIQNQSYTASLFTAFQATTQAAMVHVLDVSRTGVSPCIFRSKKTTCTEFQGHLHGKIRPPLRENGGFK